MIHVTHTAIVRAIEHIPGCDTEEKAMAAMPLGAIEKAVRFGAPFVKMSTGQHLVVRDEVVVTVLPKNMPLECLSFDSAGATGSHQDLSGE